jgi:hypothetical protein
MSTTKTTTLTSRVRLGFARADITPPVGIYHPMWGAARHHRSTGVHKPILADVIAIGPVDDEAPCLVQAFVDLVQLAQEQHDEMLGAMSSAASVPLEETILSYSHTHASGVFKLERVDLPGGEMIPGYLDEMRAKLAAASQDAAATMQEVIITYAIGRCNMAANRDYWDEANGIYVCGYNPDVPADDTLVLARITDAQGTLLGTIVNYACHATTLAWENTLISPDFVGAMREIVEQETGAPCIYVQGACGDLGPRYNYSADPAVADQNGRWLGYAALSTLQSMGPPAKDFQYAGPVVSGATLGTWAHVPFTEERLEGVSRFRGGTYTVELTPKPKPDIAALEQELHDWRARQQEADESGDTIAARDYGARAERARRWIERVMHMPEGVAFAFQYSVHRMGDALWVTCGGEPYNVLQTELRQRFPDLAVVVSPVSGSISAAYVMPTDRYGKGLYQEEPSILAAGSLEALIETISQRAQALIDS